jgi:hypothetical protein
LIRLGSNPNRALTKHLPNLSEGYRGDGTPSDHVAVGMARRRRTPT